MNRANRRRESGTDRKSTETTESTETTMGNVSHTHPYADHGAVNRPFQRGPIVAADGGERNSVSRTSEDEQGESSGSERDAYDEEAAEEERTETHEETEEADANDEEAERTPDEKMKDVDHTPPHGEGANPVFERGGKEEPVESEE